MTFDDVYNKVQEYEYGNIDYSENEFNNDIMVLLNNTYGFNPKVCAIILSYAFEAGHCGGYREVINYVSKYAKMVNACM